MTHLEATKAHYASPHLLGRIEEGLKALGKWPDKIGLEDLAAVDEFHVRGPMATAELIKLLDASERMHVLDLGSGLGGPARRLAAAVGCRVTGIDLSADYCSAGTELNRWLGLSDLVALTPGDVTDLGRFKPESFDAAWTIHVAMNIAAKNKFYAETCRVLKQEAPFVMYDIVTSGSEELYYPLPWAREASTSFPVTVSEMTGLLEGAGFHAMQITDQSAEGLEFLHLVVAGLQQASAPPPLGLHILLGPSVREILPNLVRNFEEKRIRLVAISCRKKTQSGA